MFFRNRLLRYLGGYFSRRRLPWTLSGMLHWVFVSWLILEVTSTLILLPATGRPSGNENIVELIGEQPLAVRGEVESAVDTESPGSPLRSSRPVVIADPQNDAVAAPSDVAPVEGSAVRRQVEAAITASQALTDEQKQKGLVELTATLNRVSSEERVGDVAQTLTKVLGTDARAEQPSKERPPGEFDFASAQIHEVLREELPGGKFKYICVLLDKDGRTNQSPMDEDEGKRLYDTMALIKGNPLMERIYRGVVMGLLDKLTREAGR